MIIGAQMYTTRESCQTLEGFGETLSRIADIGYKTVQVSGTCPFEGEWLKDQLARTGLKCVLTHTPPQRLLGELDLPRPAARAGDFPILRRSVNAERLGNHPYALDEDAIDALYHQILEGEAHEG